MIETIGCLESAVVEGGRLTLQGWAMPLGAGVVEGFRASWAGRPLTELEVAKGLPSPDIQSQHPSLDQSGRCRFRLRARLNGEGKTAGSAAVTCTPLIGQEEGDIMVKLIDPDIPFPSEEDIRFIGGGFLEFSCIGLGLLVQRAGLRPDSEVLDVGCGVGRVAYALTQYLRPAARYEGIDIVDRLIDWAGRTISPRFPNFSFRKADIYNKHYNPHGPVRASEYRFPYEDESFDLIFLTSVFTHMLTAEVRHYLDEFHRLLRPGGRCLSTCFLLNAESEALIRAGKSNQNLVHPLDDHCYAVLADVPEASIGFKEPALLGWIAERGFTLQGHYYGNWCGRAGRTHYQDILVYTKPES
jgi:SAM-dependent methyltransferase